MAASSTKILIGISIALFLVLWQYFVSRQEKGRRAIIVRTQMLTLLQGILSIGTIFLWKQLVTTFQQEQIGYIKRENSQSNIQKHQSEETFEKLEKYTLLFTVWKFFVFLLCAGTHVSFITNYIFVGSEPHWLTFLCYGCLGVYAQIITWLIIWTVVFKALQYGFHRKTSHMKKCALAITCTVILVSSGFYATSLPPKVVKVEIPIKKLPSDLNNIRLVQLSDLHLGPTVGKSKLQNVVDMVNELNPDIVAITGDLVDGSVNNYGTTALPLKKLIAKHGVYFVTGNHEYYTGDVDSWFTHLRTLGINVLHNENVQIPLDSQISKENKICLAGVDDTTPRRVLQGYGDHGMNLGKAVNMCDPAQPIILLAHQPSAAKEAVQSSHDISLVLSGHTHGGQFFPVVIASYFMNPFFAGLYQVGQHSYVYVTQGTFYWGIPLRIGSSMEITEITLQSFE